MLAKLVLATALVCSTLGLASVATAHTDADLVAVPAGEEATVKLEPTHGCDGSPTVDVAIRAPLEGAVAIDVEGWTSSSTPDGEGNTVLEWTGGPLPADEEGAFPIEFTAPETPGELLTFPSIQTCEDGNELSWISGDPAAEFPAPRLLILPAGSAPAATIDEVPADAPGRDQLIRIVDVDNPAEETTTPPTTEVESTTTPPASTEPDASLVQPTEPTPSTEGAPAEKSDDDSSPLPLVIGGVVVVALLVGGALYIRARRGRADVEATL